MMKLDIRRTRRKERISRFRRKIEKSKRKRKIILIAGNLMIEKERFLDGLVEGI
jgi:hypothetical protein